MHLVSDVPFGAFLSGGIDSSTVVAQMSRHLEIPVKTFTIGFEEASYDERVYAQKVAEFTGSEHHIEIISPESFNLLDDLIYKLAEHYGEPFADSSAIPTYFVSRLARAEVKMVLSGDGGDELFAGYNTYTNILGSMDGRNRGLKKFFSRFLTVKAMTIIEKAKALPSGDALDLHGNYYAYFRDDERNNLYCPELARKLNRKKDDLFKDFFNKSKAKECLSALQYLDIKTYLCGDILTKVDIASMMHSLEVRVPLLDHKVIELAAKVPVELKLRLSANGDIQKKYLLKKYADKLFHPSYFDRPKQGFGVPIDNWFGGRLYDDVKEKITRKGGILHGLFKSESLLELVSSPERARNNSGRIWALLFLDAWSRQFGISAELG